MTDGGAPRDCGPYFCPATAFLPKYVRPGHSFLVLRDRLLDRLALDGCSVADPEAPHPHFRGGFRGYFNVPPGHHAVTAYWGERATCWELDVAPNEAYVKRMDWDRGGWVDDDAQTMQRYRELALSGSMLAAGALRPWPLASLGLIGRLDGVSVDEVPVPDRGGFVLVTNLRPGPHLLGTRTHQAGCELPPASLQLIDLSGAQPTFVSASLGDPMTWLHLVRAPAGAIVTIEELRRPPIFGPADLAQARAALEDAGTPAGAAAALQALRRHYIVDFEMKQQTPYFREYGAMVVEAVRRSPILARVEATRLYLGYLAEDLQDIDDEAAAASGRLLRHLLDESAGS